MAQAQDGFKDFVLDQLADMRGMVGRRMFGGYGLYCRDRFFGIIFRSRLYFKVSGATRPAYENYGMKPFRPSPKQTLSSFYEVPADIIEQSEELAAWASGAVASATEPATVRPKQTRTTRRRVARR